MKFIRDIIGEKRQMDRTDNGAPVAKPMENLLADENMAKADTVPEKPEPRAEPRLTDTASEMLSAVEEVQDHKVAGSDITDDFAAFFAKNDLSEDDTAEIEVEELVHVPIPSKLVLGEAALVNSEMADTDTADVFEETVDTEPMNDVANVDDRVSASDLGPDEPSRATFRDVNGTVAQEAVREEHVVRAIPAMTDRLETETAEAVQCTPLDRPRTPAHPTPIPQSAVQISQEQSEPRPKAPQSAEVHQTVEVPQPAIGRSSGSHSRTRTRILGFNTAEGTGIDPISRSKEATTAAYTMFPVGWLIVVDGAGRGSAFTLFNGVSNIGRGEDQTVRLDFGDNAISRENHASIAYDPRQKSFFIGQGGKANLVRRNDRPVLSTEEMSAGDLVTVGETTLRFVPFCSSDFSWESCKTQAEPMHPATDFIYETSTAIDLGRRERQEDAVASDFSSGEAFGFAVLADGMGGHAAGDVASKIVVTEMFSELKLQSGDPKLLEPRIAEVLKAAAIQANNCLGLYAQENPNSNGMGATLLAPVLINDHLYWVSVGDSPFYLFRDGKLIRLNENHALFAQVEYLVSNGIMNCEEALNYPDQGCLTSVLIGGEISQIDCRTKPVAVMEGDILIAASDGLQFLSEEQIEGTLRFKHKRSASEISATLIKEVRNLEDPYQDNISLCVIKAMRQGSAAATEDTSKTVSLSKTSKHETITILARVKRAPKAAGRG